jgi:hypothetical protein
MEEEKKKFWSKRNLVALFIIIVMVGSSAGFIFGRDEGYSSKYNGLKFKLINNVWLTKINDQEVRFHFHPAEVENLSVSNDSIEKLDMPSIYFTFEAGKNLQYVDMVRYEFITSLQEQLNIYVTSGVLNKTEEYNFPVINCENATEEMPVLKFIFSNETRVYSDGNCVIAEAQSEQEMLAISDRIRYGLFGVI